MDKSIRHLFLHKWTSWLRFPAKGKQEGVYRYCKAGATLTVGDLLWVREPVGVLELVRVPDGVPEGVNVGDGVPDGEAPPDIEAVAEGVCEGVGSITPTT